MHNFSSACSGVSCHWSMNEEGTCRFAYVGEMQRKETWV